MIIHLNGWPGVGKKTIGKVLAARLSARFIHNHLLHDVAIACCGFNAPDRWIVYEQVRAAVYEALAGRPSDEIIVMTNALCAGAPHEVKAWNHVVELAANRRVPLIPVILQADAAENERRIQSETRVGQKMTDHLVLRSFVETDTIHKPDMAELLVLDVTRLSPAESASAIEDHIRRLNPTSLSTT